MNRKKQPVSSLFPSHSKSTAPEETSSTGHLTDEEEKLLREALTPNPVRDILKPLCTVDEIGCFSCKGHRNECLHQTRYSADLKITRLNVDAKIIRVMHLSTNNPGDYYKFETIYELAIIDFLFPLTVTKDLHRYIPFLGFSNFVRMGDPEEGEEEQLWFARCMIATCPKPKNVQSPEDLLKDVEMYTAPHFGDLEWTRCPNTVISFLNRMNLTSKGYRLVRIIMPTEENDGNAYEDYSEIHLQ